MLMVLGVVLILAGGVRLAQGLDLPFAPGSFMSADPTWAVIGAITLGAGVVIAARAVRDRRRPPDNPEGD